MAQTLNTIRSRILTSVHGRRLGIDNDEFLVGTKGPRYVVTDATSATTGTNLPNHGVITFDSTTGDTWVIDDPEAGVVAHLVSISTGGAQVINTNNATFMTSGSSTGGVLTLTGLAGVTLVGVSTALWAFAGSFGTTVAAHPTT